MKTTSIGTCLQQLELDTCSRIFAENLCVCTNE